MSNGNGKPEVVDLLLRVERSTDNRLTGTVAVNGSANARDFSGTLELMRAFEELVPIVPAAGEPAPASNVDATVPAAE
jgi:hypothetical protein